MTEPIRILLNLASGDESRSLSADWNQLLQQISGAESTVWNRLFLPIFEALKKRNILASLKPELRDALKQKYFSMVAFHLRQADVLKKLLNAWLPSEIKIILLKNAALMGVVYSGKYPRVAMDIDFLVQKKDFRKVCDILSAHCRPQIEEQGRPVTTRLRHERAFIVENETNLVVEPHYRLSMPGCFAISYEDIWDQSVPHPSYSRDSIRMMQPMDNLTYLVIHSFQHLDFEPHHLVDAYRLIRHFNIQGPEFLRHAKKWHAGTAAMVLSEMLHEWFEMDLGVKSLQGWRSALAKRLFTISREQYLSPRIPSRTSQLLSMALMDNPIDSLRLSGYYFMLRCLDLAGNAIGNEKKTK